MFFFFFNDTATTEIYTLSLHDALPIYRRDKCPSSSKSSTIFGHIDKWRRQSPPRFNSRTIRTPVVFPTTQPSAFCQVCQSSVLLDPTQHLLRSDKMRAISKRICTSKTSLISYLPPSKIHCQ